MTQPLDLEALKAKTPQKLAAEKRKREQQERAAFPFGRVPSEIVKAFIRFDSHQQHLHSWHELQDCLEMLRKVEAEQATALAAKDAEIAGLTARVREQEGKQC